MLAELCRVQICSEVAEGGQMDLRALLGTSRALRRYKGGTTGQPLATSAHVTCNH